MDMLGIVFLRTAEGGLPSLPPPGQETVPDHQAGPEITDSRDWMEPQLLIKPVTVAMEERRH